MCSHDDNCLNSNSLSVQFNKLLFSKYFCQGNADQGFAATNHSGTQINLWGQVPGLNWDVRGPNASNIYGSYYNPIGPTVIQPPYQQPVIPAGMENAVTHSQLTAIATHLTQCIDQTRHMTVAEVRESLKQLADKLTECKPVNQLEARPLLAISNGHGDLQTQLEHIHRHLLEYSRRDPDLSNAIGQVRIGKVLSADFDEDESSFLLTVQLEKPEEMKRCKSSNTDKVRSHPFKSADSKKSPEPVKDRQVNEAKKDKATPPKDTEKNQIESADKKKPAMKSNYPGSAYGGGYGETSAPFGSAISGNASQPRTSYPGAPPEPFGTPGLGYDPYGAGSQIGGQYPSGPQTGGWVSGQPEIGANLVEAVKISAGISDPYGQPFSSHPTDVFGQERNQQMPGFQPGFHSEAPDGDIYAPTLKPYPKFNATEDCERLRKAMKGMGTDEKTIIDIMGHRSADQRTKIVLQFKTMYGKDLIKEFKSELSGHFYEAVEALCYSPADFDAMQLRKAVKGAGTDEDALIEIVCSRTNEQIRQIKEAYARIFPGRNLETDVSHDTSRHFKRIMISLLQANRDESPNVDRNAARRDAEELYQAGEKKLGTDESKFNMILAAKSFAHLRLVFEEYAKVSKNDIEKALKSEMSGDLLKSMLAIVRCIRNKQKYFAYQLMKSMKGLGTKDRTLIRIVVSRCEIDMALIKKEFLKDNGKTLEAWITDDTTGDYRKLMLALIAE
ncbi:annexin A7/11 [Paragonimus westermani]|uniref:Annexin n=1 Tax=Paragonimus westermani TaxID=34504 RepID=A0A5J4NZW9_9TREM|nr:annexin A7/11 [Paragonimus westermani]